MDDNADFTRSLKNFKNDFFKDLVDMIDISSNGALEILLCMGMWSIDSFKELSMKSPVRIQSIL